MKLARPSATWKKDLHINAVQKQRDQLRMKHTRTKQEKYGRDLGIFGISQKKKKKTKKQKHYSTRKHYQNAPKKSGKPYIEYLTQVKQD